MSAEMLSIDRAHSLIRRNGRGSIKKFSTLYPYLPHIQFPKAPKIRFFPGPYIEEYAKYLRRNSLNVGVESARAFSKTTRAKELMQEAQVELEGWLTSRDSHTINEIAEFFKQVPETVAKWRLSRHLFTGKVAKGRSNRGRSAYIPHDELRESFVWVLPLPTED